MGCGIKIIVAQSDDSMNTHQQSEAKSIAAVIMPQQNITSARPVKGDRQTITSSWGESAAVKLGQGTHVVVVLTPPCLGSIEDQIIESLSMLDAILEKQSVAQEVISQTVFLKNPADRPTCDRLFTAHYGSELPVTAYVYQSPCNGAAVAIEAWCAGGKLVRVTRPHPQVSVVNHDDLSWIYCGLTPSPTANGVYTSVINGFAEIGKLLAKPAISFDRVIRLWIYLGNINGVANQLERYTELNRARTVFYRDFEFGRGIKVEGQKNIVYPASTGIGMAGSDLALSSLALSTVRNDVFLLPIENPNQTPAYHYPPVYSLESPKFVRALAVVIGKDVVTWLSGTASILNSESRHIGDIRKQTEQALDNIERLIAPANYKAHGLGGAGASLPEIAQMRVYLKRPQDYEVCRDICRQRLGQVPVLYVAADVCRSNLLVEMEGVLFTKLNRELTNRQ